VTSDLGGRLVPVDQGEGYSPAIITDHKFEPRKSNPYLCGFSYGHRWGEYAFRECKLAEAAHAETTVER
jgi:hypothetical protein